jgi:hypothetical protein
MKNTQNLLNYNKKAFIMAGLASSMLCLCFGSCEQVH